MKYWEELCVSDAKISNFRLIWPARIHVIFFFSKFLAWRYRHYEANQPRIVSIKYVYQHDFVDWLRRITCFRRKTGAKCQNFGSLAIIFLFRVYGFLVGINHHEEDHITCVQTQGHDLLYQRTMWFINKMFQTKNTKIFGSLAVSIAFPWVSARSLCSLATINGFFPRVFGR